MTVPLLSARNITKTFGQVLALSRLDFSLEAGEITALVGDNGAGKSTLVKILAGVHLPDEGSMEIDGIPVSISSPMEAQKLGISPVFQDLSLAPDLSPAQNLFLGREIKFRGLAGAFGFLRHEEMLREATLEFDKIGVAVKSPRLPLANLSGGQQQGVAIARAARWSSRIIILDEPTAALGVVQTERVYSMIRRVADQGLGVLLVTHNMSDVVRHADKVQVLRLGQRVAQFGRKEISVGALVEAMTSDPKEAAK